MAVYLGREYYLQQRWQDAIAELERYLDLAAATWPDERSQAWLWLARCWKQLSNAERAAHCIWRALAEAPQRPEGWLALAYLHYERQEWGACYGACMIVLSLPRTSGNYFDEVHTWGAVPYDLAALSAHQLGLRDQAHAYGQQAVQLEPDNARLKHNLQYYTAPTGH